MMLQRRSICALWAFSLCFTFLADLHADGPSYVRGTELTSQFEIEASALRKSIRNGEFTFDLTVTNASQQVHRGPLALVIEKTGVESLLPKKFDHQFVDDGQGFLELINENQALKSGETFKLRRVRLKSDEDLETDPTEQFSLVARIYEIKIAGQNVAGRGKVPEKMIRGPGLPGGIPRRPSEPASGQDTGEPVEAGEVEANEPERGLTPVPDPIGDTGEEEEQQTSEADEPADDAPAEPPEGENPGDEITNFERPPRLPTEEELEQALAAKNAWSDKILKIEGVHSIARRWGKEGSAVVSVQVEQFGQKKNVPSELDGVPVEVYVEPMARALDRRGQIGFMRPIPLCDDGDPRELYDRPSRIGVSGWNENLFGCATGTLGCRLENPADPSFKYILSNSHVLADIGLGISGGGFAFFGDPVIQPGPLDFSCAVAPMSNVGVLAGWDTLNPGAFNLTDAAIARTGPLFFSTSTPCNGYGVPRETTVAASIGMEVMKFGRSSSFTTGVVISDNAISIVDYGVTGPFLVPFINQIRIVVDPEFVTFGAPGDSGSLIVSRAGRYPVALLFAGSSFSTLGNPIDDVLFNMGGLRVDGQP